MHRGAVEVALLFALGFPGWFIFQALGVPAAALLGSMVSVAVFKGVGIGPPGAPQWIKPILQVLVGLFVGARFDRRTGQEIKKMALPACVVSAWWLGASFVTGYLLHSLTSLDLRTAFLGSTPGGIAEMSLLALSLGGEPASVALLQFFRLASILLVVPWATPLLCRRFVQGGGRGFGLPGSAGFIRPTSSPSRDLRSRGLKALGTAFGWRSASCRGVGVGEGPGQGAGSVEFTVVLSYLRTLAIGFAAGLGLYITGFPAGGMVGSMAAAMVLQLKGLACQPLPEAVKSWAQVGLGGLIGLNFSKEMLASLVGMAGPVVLLTFAMLVNGFLLAACIQRLTRRDMETCVLSTCAAGLSQMSVVAEDLGGNPVIVTIFHLVRLVSILAVLPPVFGFALR